MNAIIHNLNPTPSTPPQPIPATIPFPSPALLRSPSGCATPPRLSPVNERPQLEPAVRPRRQPLGPTPRPIWCRTACRSDGQTGCRGGRTTAHWVSGQLVVADRDDLELFGDARRSHRDDVADLYLQERRRDRRDPRDAPAGGIELVDADDVTVPSAPDSSATVGSEPMPAQAPQCFLPRRHKALRSPSA